MSDIAALNQTLYSLIATVNRDEINLAAYQREVDTMYLLICGALVVFSTYTHTHTHLKTHVVFTNTYNSASRICDD